MRRIQAILLAALLPVFAFAQRQMDREMEFLLDAVCELRNGNESTFNRIRDRLSKDELWTPMNETGAFLWEGIEEGLTEEELCKKLCVEYEAEPSEEAQIGEDVEEFLSQLKTLGVLEEDGRP